ncbi:MAG TPA: DUF6600 domain-containing protein [Holophagaceae bacterium]|nr:DUF6600 domain-containing protein [Holophagaceae bacterium]
MRDHLRIPLLLALSLPGILGSTSLTAQARPEASGQDRDEPQDDENYQGEAPERYARVRALEGDVRIRKGELDEELSRGTPIGEGDVLESKGRGVVQLLDGTRIAFAGATRFTVAALFKDAKGERQVLLRLDYGRLRVTLGGESEAKFRIDTPSGQVTCFDKGSFSVETERDHTLRVKVHAGRVTVRNERDEARISGGERITVYGTQDRLDRVRDFNTYEEDEFDRWSDRTGTARRGQSWERVPAELRHYSDDLDENGEWVNSPEYGWVWRPAVTDQEWRPYWRGRWAAYPGGMTWVSDEPWGYMTYHHGRWSWGVGLGWYWIPGVNYSPAWVAWRYYDGNCGWAPLNYYNAPCDWGYGAWHGYGAWNVVSINHITVYNVGSHCYRDRQVIGAFRPTGTSTWAGGRSTTPPWTRTPLMARPTEVRSAATFQRVFQRDEGRSRLQAYDQQARATTGRSILRRVPSPANPAGNGSGVTPGRPTNRVPFEDRSPQQSTERTRGWLKPADRGVERPVDRPRDLGPGRETSPRQDRPVERPVDRPRDLNPGRETNPRQDRPMDRPVDRPRDLGPGRETNPRQDRPMDRPVDRPRDLNPGRETSPRQDRPVERPVDRPRDFDREPSRERRSDPPRERQEERPRREESRPAPREERAPAPRQESRPAPAPAPRPEPAPRREGRGRQ